MFKNLVHLRPLIMGNITFTMIKPDAVGSHYIGPILEQINAAGFQIIALKLLKMSKEDAGRFYVVHKDRPFYNELTQYMSSGPIVAAVLQKDQAVTEFRKLIGATDPSKAEPGTIRQRFAKSIAANAIHGSDSDENALIESAFFFSELERF
jgi:nucleoside-diphosphate kinase